MDIGIIGAGNNGKGHMIRLDEIDAADVTAVCDIDEARAREAAEPRNATVYTDYEEMYATEDLDAVYICIPPFARERQAIDAAERGIHLFLEKPVALTKEKAYEIETAVEENGIVTQVGFVRRYSKLVERALELMDDRTIVNIEALRYTGMPREGWSREKSKSGGQILEVVIHEYDLMRYLGGEVKRVAAYGGKKAFPEEIDYEDTTTSIMTHENGAVSHVSGSQIASDGYRAIHILGEDLRLQIHSSALTGTVDGESINYEPERTASIEHEREFVRAVQENDPNLSRAPLSEGVKTLELALAIDESIQTGNPVELE